MLKKIQLLVILLYTTGTARSMFYPSYDPSFMHFLMKTAAAKRKAKNPPIFKAIENNDVNTTLNLLTKLKEIPTISIKTGKKNPASLMNLSLSCLQKKVDISENTEVKKILQDLLITKRMFEKMQYVISGEGKEKNNLVSFANQTLSIKIYEILKKIQQTKNIEDLPADIKDKLIDAAFE